MKNKKPTGSEDKDLKLLIMIYSTISLIVLLAMQLGRYQSPQQRFQVTLIVLAVILGIGYRVTRKFKKGMERQEEVIKKIREEQKKEEE